MPEKIKILLVLGRLDFGGIQNHVLDIIRYSDRERFQFDVCEMATEPGALEQQAREMGAGIFQCSLRVNPQSFCSRFFRLLRKGKYDVIHVHRHDISALPVLTLALCCGIKKRIVHYHNKKLTMPRTCRSVADIWRNKVIRLMASDVCACSSYVLRSHFGVNAQSKSGLNVVYNGVDLDRFTVGVSDRNSFRRELGIPEDVVLIGNCSRMDVQKNPLFFVDVARGVLSQNSQVRFLWVGEGPLSAQVQERINQSGFSDRIIVVPYRHDMPRVLAGLDILFFPSLWEGFSLLLLEAQAAGLPCVCFAEPYSEEAIPPAMQEFLIETGNAGSAIEKLLFLAAHSGLRRELGVSGYNHVRNFTVRGTVEKIQKFYLKGIQ